jgi:hypothetical protein
MEVKFRVSVFVTGVKKRCRKVDTHTLSLGYIDYNDGIFDKSDLENKARALLQENMKSVVTVAVNLTRVEIDRSESGYAMEKFLMFDKRHAFFRLEPSELVSALT